MHTTELLYRFVAGGSIVLAATVLAKTKYPMLSGIVLLFPAITLIGYYFIGQTVDTTQLKHITKFSVYALSTTFIFLVSFYYSQDTMSVPNSLLVSTTAWLLSAGALIGITNTI